ncbi:hypothetical protein MNBD_GAMMA12-3798 [hydrothermal vent metagenome]|uniref:SAM-dependent methyltransferase n=1 Tax=hydrothermal vent metagenome TaxID=652676 RepID=A0A3B0YBB3_9ZZZZ
MDLSKVVPWGRSLNEYVEMFSLSNDDLCKKILGCGDGPASFNAELTARGGNVTSIDPIYSFNPDEIQLRMDEVYPQIMEQVAKNMSDYVWDKINSTDQLGKIRMNAMNTFLLDYEQYQESERYIDASLPQLSFGALEFDLALCSHYLFLYSEHVSQEQHVHSVKELCRISKEVRIYPLLTISSNKESPHLQPVMSSLIEDGFDVSLQAVKYQFQKGATEMLVIKNNEKCIINSPSIFFSR